MAYFLWRSEKRELQSDLGFSKKMRAASSSKGGSTARF
jgi:hypothetical protein